MQNQTSKTNAHIDPVSSRERKKEFDSKPGKRLSVGVGKKKGWWSRHCERLKAAHCDRTMDCFFDTDV